ncbi:MAG: FAD-binding oxidoreductase [Nevskiaceae bacterium]
MDTRASLDDLQRALETDECITDPAVCEVFSSDVYSRGIRVAAVLRPKTKERLAHMIAAAGRAGFAIVARGGGLTYTGGYLAAHERVVALDTSAMNRIIKISAEDLYITVEAGVTWKQIYEALTPLGLRLPFFGTFSGARATVGGGLANGALFLGTARHGTAADCVLGLEVVLGDGRLLTTGQAGFRNVEKPFYRTCGPDLTGLFLHDSGTLGVKVQATFRLMRMPEVTGHASFVFDGMSRAAAALSEVARTGAAEDAYVFDPAATHGSLRSQGLFKDAGMLIKVMRNERGLWRAAIEGARLVLAGRNFLPTEAHSLDVCCAGRDRASVAADLEACRKACLDLGGREIPSTIPRAVRADLFPTPDGVVGDDGHRWAALNAKVAHSDAERIINAAKAIIAPDRERMTQQGVRMSHLLIATGTHAFSFEPVFRWRDEWLPLHEQVLSEAAKRRLPTPVSQPAAAALVAEMRQRLVELFAELGAASNQLGKTYPYFDSLRPETAQLVQQIKQVVDPQGVLNPGGLGIPSGKGQ